MIKNYSDGEIDTKVLKDNLKSINCQMETVKSELKSANKSLKLKEKEIHITSENCPVYSDIREKYSDFNNDEDLVSYFNEVLERRDQINTLEQDEEDYKD